MGPDEPAPRERPRISCLAWPAFANRHLNPYNWLLYTHLTEIGVKVEEFSTSRLLLSDASILHLHWSPTSRIRGGSRTRVFFRAGALLAELALARRRGVRVVWTCHNLAAHDSRPYPALETRYWQLLPRLLDGIISLSEFGVHQLHECYPALRAVPTFVVPHGHYRTVYPREATRETARGQLGIAADANVFAFVGQVRPYKNLLTLLRAFRRLEDVNAVLLIAGKIKLGEQLAEFVELIAQDSRVRLFDRFIPDDELQYFFAAADLVVLPFREILNSGSAILALSFDRPVLVPAEGALRELAGQVGSEWALTYEGELSADSLLRARDAARRCTGTIVPLAAFDWPHVARLTNDVYRAVLQ